MEVGRGANFLPFMDTYILYQGSKRLTFKAEDMQVEKISRIFQVTRSSLYLTDDTNVAIFPGQQGSFSSLDLSYRAHYEVHGDIIETTIPTTSSSSPAGLISSPQFTFARPSPSSSFGSASPVHPRASIARTWTRAITVADVVEGKPLPNRVLMVRFGETEANVPTIVQKLMLDLKTTEPLVLTDTNWTEIMDSEGTRGSLYWRQNSRKINAVFQSDFSRLQQKKKRTRDDSALQEIQDKIEEVLEASHGLEGVTATLRELSNSASSRDVINLTRDQATQLKEAFICLVCRDVIEEPMLSGCCRSLVGCRTCMEQWAQSSSQCVKCRADSPLDNIHRVSGLSSALSVLKEL